MIRSAKAHINLQALHHNLSVARRRAMNSHVLGVIKADAYGHGLVPVAETLAPDVSGLAISCIEEGEILREAGYEGRIVLLHGIERADDLDEAARFRLDLVVHHPAQGKWLEESSISQPLDVWIKVDSGMHRLGVPKDDFAGLFHRLAGLSAVGTIRAMTHFADADDQGSHYTAQQLKHFDMALGGQDIEQSCANSAGVLGHPDSHRNWVRPGIMLYGSSPFVNSSALADGLMPVMELTAPLIAIQHYRKGDTVGYGRTWTCPEDMPVGVVAIGYGDGYPRHAPSGTPTMLNGVIAPLVGRVSMDLVTIDLREVGGAEIGLPVELWGNHVSVDTVASMSGTISYEILCAVGPRAERTFSR
jgi:alanine racemase